MSETELIVEFKGDDSSYKNFNFNAFSKLNKWEKIELKYDFVSSAATLVFYFWNKNTGQKAFYDNVKIDIYHKYTLLTLFSITFEQ